MLSEEELRDIDKAIEREKVEYEVGDLVLFSGAMYTTKGNDSIQVDSLLTGEFSKLYGNILTVKRVSKYGGHGVFKHWYSVAKQTDFFEQDKWMELHGCEMIKAELRLKEDLL